MKIQHRAPIGLIAGALLLGTAACSDNYDREEFISEAETELDLTNEQATCLTDNLEATLGSDELSDLNFKDERAPSDEQVEALMTAAGECGFGT
jgi:hypothetical protein